MTDKFLGQAYDLESPSQELIAITPNDGADLAVYTRAIYVGGAGNISVIPLVGSTPVTFVGLQAGQLLPIRVKRVRATGTTATDIVGLV